MHSKGTIFITLISLCCVLIITLTAMFTNTKTGKLDASFSTDDLTNLLAEDNFLDKEIEKQELINDREKNFKEQEESQDENTEEKEVNKKQEKETGSNSSDSVAADKEIQNNTQKDSVINQNLQTKKEDRHLNQQTNNTNILCLGIADKELEMISVYSINAENKKSAGIFLPTYVSLKVNGQLLTLKEIYNNLGVLSLKEVLSQCLEIDIPYHMVVDKQGLVELSEVLGPIYVENESIDIPNLFVKPVSSKDDAILQEMAQKVSQPRMILQLPRLIKIFIDNVESDIGVSDLWDLYQVFSNLNHSQLAKVVLWGEKVKMAGETYTFIDPYDWHNVIYEMTE